MATTWRSRMTTSLSLSEAKLAIKNAIANGWLPKMSCKVWEDSSGSRKVRMNNCHLLEENHNENLLIKNDLMGALLKRLETLTRYHVFTNPELKEKIFNNMTLNDVDKKINSHELLNDSHLQDYLAKRVVVIREVDNKKISFEQLYADLKTFYQPYLKKD
jgi:hypothetical protein